jgi:hypothetical protein
VTPLVVVILAAMWVLVLVPPLLRSRTDGRPSASVHSFRRQLSTLGRATPTMARAGRPYGRPAAPYRPSARGAASYGSTTSRSSYGQQGRISQRSAAKHRRQSVLLTLAGAAFFTGVLAFGLGMSAMLWVHLGIDAALLGYVYLLVSMRKAEEAKAYRSSWYEAA